MVFVNTKRNCRRARSHFDRELFRRACDLWRRARNQALENMRDFHNGDIAVLIATDVASRGLHSPDVSHFFNFDLPNDSEITFIASAARARREADGDAISLSARNTAPLPDIARSTAIQIPRAAIRPDEIGGGDRTAARLMARTSTPQGHSRARRTLRRRSSRGGHSSGGPLRVGVINRRLPCRGDSGRFRGAKAARAAPPPPPESRRAALALSQSKPQPQQPSPTQPQPMLRSGYAPVRLPRAYVVTDSGRRGSSAVRASTLRRRRRRRRGADPPASAEQPPPRRAGPATYLGACPSMIARARPLV